MTAMQNGEIETPADPDPAGNPVPEEAIPEPSQTESQADPDREGVIPELSQTGPRAADPEGVLPDPPLKDTTSAPLHEEVIPKSSLTEVTTVPVPKELKPGSPYPDAPERSAKTPEKIIFIDEEVKVILIGIIILALIAISLMVVSVAPLLAGTGLNSSSAKGIPVSSGGSLATDLPETEGEIRVVPTASITPVIISSAPAAAATAVPVRTAPQSYVTIAPRETDPIPQYHDLAPSIPEKKFENLFTVYSLTNQNVGENFPYILYSLQTPPLVIDCDVRLTNITDEKYYEYKIKANKYEVSKKNIRPYENAYFSIIVRDQDTGEIVAEDGIGRTYDIFQTQKQIVIYKAGNYIIDLSGRTATVTLEMKIPRW